MKLLDYSALCFDMDFTLVNYCMKNFAPMIYDVTAKFLVECRGYPSNLLQLRESDYKLMRRGLILDHKTHCFIDVSSTGTVISALKGMKMLSKEQIFEIYPHGTYPDFEKNYNPSDRGRMLTRFGSAFTSPTIPLVAKQLDTIFKDKPATDDERFEKLYAHLIESFTFNFHPDSFQRKTSSYFTEMESNTSLYIARASINLRTKLRQLKSKGIKIILITASHIDYTELLMKYSYGDDWREYFHVVCCRAQKPGFFSMLADDRPFYRWNPATLTSEEMSVQEVNSTDVFLEGHWTVVDKWIKKNSSTEGKRIVYVGDSFESDIIPTKTSSNWDSFAIVMEGLQYKKVEEEEKDLEHVNKKRNISDDEAWGSFFGTAEQRTVYGGKLLDYADLILSDVEALADLKLDQEFSSGKTGNFFDFNPC